jgi:Fe-S-cluster containining protein
MKKLNIFYILLLSVTAFNAFAILDCDLDSDCVGLSGNNKCNSSAQCELVGGDEFLGDEYCDFE